MGDPQSADGTRHDSRHHWPDGDHFGTLLQDCPRHRSPEILSQLDDVGGRCAAVAGWNMSDSVPRTRHNKDRQGTMFETDLLAERSHGIGKLIWKHFVDMSAF